MSSLRLGNPKTESPFILLIIEPTVGLGEPEDESASLAGGLNIGSSDIVDEVVDEVLAKRGGRIRDTGVEEADEAKLIDPSPCTLPTELGEDGKGREENGGLNPRLSPEGDCKGETLDAELMLGVGLEVLELLVGEVAADGSIFSDFLRPCNPSCS